MYTQREELLIKKGMLTAELQFIETELKRSPNGAVQTVSPKRIVKKRSPRRIRDANGNLVAKPLPHTHTQVSQ